MTAKLGFNSGYAFSLLLRIGDKGPYAAWNIRCETVAGNHEEYNGHRQIPRGKHRPRIKPAIVVKIYKADGRYADIAEQYGVDPHQVHCIKTKKYYRKLTDALDAN